MPPLDFHVPPLSPDPPVQLIPNHTLKSLIQGWASRHYIVDLGRFSKARRTKRATPSKQPATEAAIGTSGSPSTTPASPRTAEHQGPDSPTHRLEGGASRSEGHHAEPPALPPPRPARPLYPDPGDPASARLGLDGVPEALAALHPSRLAAGGYPAQAKAAYAARTLSTLASQREAQDAMMEVRARVLWVQCVRRKPRLCGRRWGLTCCIWNWVLDPPTSCSSGGWGRLFLELYPAESLAPPSLCPILSTAAPSSATGPRPAGQAAGASRRHTPPPPNPAAAGRCGWLAAAPLAIMCWRGG